MDVSRRLIKASVTSVFVLVLDEALDYQALNKLWPKSLTRYTHHMYPYAKYLTLANKWLHIIPGR